VDDEILAIDDYRVRADRLDNRLEQYRPGDKAVSSSRAASSCCGSSSRSAPNPLAPGGSR
jgi:hypothetical protein